MLANHVQTHEPENGDVDVPRSSAIIITFDEEVEVLLVSDTMAVSCGDNLLQGVCLPLLQPLLNSFGIGFFSLFIIPMLSTPLILFIKIAQTISSSTQ